MQHHGELNPSHLVRVLAGAACLLLTFSAAAQPPKPPKPKVPRTAPAPTPAASGSAAPATPALPAPPPAASASPAAPAAPSPAEPPTTGAPPTGAAPATAPTPSEAPATGSEAGPGAPVAALSGGDAPPPTSALATLGDRIRAQRTRAEQFRKTVWRMRGSKVLTPAEASHYEAQLDAWLTALDIASNGIAELEKSEQTERTREQQQKDAKQQDRLDNAVTAAENGLEATGNQLAALEYTTGWDLVGTLLRARCNTAICFDNGDKKNWLGIEPLVELPTGKSFSLSDSTLSSYVDNHDLRIDLAAGARVWLFRDVVSVSVYISKPLTDAPVRLEGSSFVYPASSVRRPYPGIALGLLFDSLWLGFDRDELRNGDGQDPAALNPEYPPNEVISASWTLTVALQPVTAFRSAIGTAVQATNGKDE